MSEKRLRMALVGAGNVAKKYVEAFDGIVTGSLDAVVGTTASKAKAFAKAHGIPHSARTIGDLFQQVPIDAIIVATPSGVHWRCAIEAAQHGKHVLCEKPLDVALDKIDAMTRACEQAGVKLACVNGGAKVQRLAGAE